MSFSKEDILEEFCSNAHLTREHNTRHKSESWEGYLWSLLLAKRERTRLSVENYRKKPGVRAKLSAYMKEYYLRPGVRERCLAYNRMRLSDHAYVAAQKARGIAWRTKNRELIKKRERERRMAARRAAGVRGNLTPQQRSEIQDKAQQGRTGVSLAKEYGVHEQTIRRIKQGLTRSNGSRKQ